MPVEACGHECASQDQLQQGKAGFLVSSYDHARVRAVVQGVDLAPICSGIVWWIDNIAALMALVRGRSEHDELDRLAQIAPSSANWSDRMS